MRKFVLVAIGLAGLAFSLSGCIYPGYRHHDGGYGGYDRAPPGYGGGYEHPPPPPPGYGGGYGHPLGY